MEKRSDPASWHRVREVFDAVVSLAPAERDARLADLCVDDPALRREVESLLSHDSASQDDFESIVGRAAVAVTAEETALHAGQSLLHYSLTTKIGQGGMGVVWKATDRTLGRAVAIKVLPESVGANRSRLGRFEREAKLLAALNHPNIAAIYSIHEHERVRFLAMEYVDGEDLAVRIASGALPVAQLLAIARQIAEALEEAHEKGIVHRDLKPSNVKLKPDGKVKVLDFGLARVFADDASLGSIDPNETAKGESVATQAGLVIGTAAYMPPEQARGLAVDKRADNWAFGVMLFEMLSGRRPFAGPTLTDVLAAVVTAEPDWRLLPATTPPALVRLVRRCLEKDVRRRLRDIGDARIEIDALIDGAASDGSVIAVPPPRWSRPQWRQAAMFLLGAAAAGLIAWLVTRAAAVAPDVRALNTRNPVTASATRSIAVLPLVDLSAQRDQQYFADGLTEDLLNALASNPQLRVAGRTSAFQFRNSQDDPREIGKKLNVVNLLEGSVRKTDKRVRITARLVNTSDGFNLWSETYDREMNDIFAIQADIARSVADALRVTLLGGERTKSVARGTKPPAYNAYLQGRYFRQLNTKESLEKARQYYEEAVALDPDYAPAWTGLALVYGTQASEGYSPVTVGYEKARKAVEHALALDPNLGEAHAALAFIRRAYDWDWVGANVAARRAMELEPGNGAVILGVARVASGLGGMDEALDLTRRAAMSDPLNVAIHYRLARYEYFLGRLDQAVASFTKVLELNPEYPAAHEDLAIVYLAQSRPEAALAEMEREKADLWRRYGFSMVYYALGRHQEADATLLEFVKNYRQTAAYQIAEVYAFRGELDRAFEWLERAYVQRDSGLSQIKGDPHFKRLDRDPRYAALLEKMHLPH